MGWPLYAIYAGVLAGQYIYHRLTYEPPRPPPPKEIKIPTSEEGAAIPLLYGRTLVRAPIVAWAGKESFPPESESYLVHILYIAGIPFRNGTTTLERIYLQNEPFLDPDGLTHLLSPEVGAGNTSNSGDVGSYHGDPFLLNVTFGDGRTTQDLSGSAAEFWMTSDGIPSTAIPGYRGYAIVHTSYQGGSDVPAVAFEISTYPAGFSTTSVIGQDVNPVNVIQDLLCGTLGKLGLDASVIDADSFNEAAETLKDEENGYSRCIDEIREASDIINEILEQIDGVLYEDWSDGETASVKIKLIRPDYSVNLIPHITPANCSRVENFAASGHTDVINKIRVVYADRANNYVEASATAQNLANVVSQGNRVNEAVLHYPGVHEAENARNIAARELAARSRPITRCRVTVDRTFLRVNPGDAVKLTWPEYHLSNRVYRVAAVDRGTLQDGSIRLDLIEDYFFVHRFMLPGGPTTPPFPASGGLDAG
jgi:hypothetical protein